MKGMVFAAGLGTRLRPLTDTVPKALVELGGVAMLERVLLHMKECGVEEAVVNVHHFAGKVREFLRANDNFGMHLHVSDESELLLDTGGGVVASSRWLAGDEPVLLHNADIYTDVDLGDMARTHKASGADATLLVAARDTSRYLLFDEEMRMHGWTDIRNGAVRPEGVAVNDFSQYAFGGVHIISPRLLSDLCRYAQNTGRRVFSITDYYIDSCCRMDIRGALQPEAARWHDIGTLDKLHRAEADIR